MLSGKGSVEEDVIVEVSGAIKILWEVRSLCLDVKIMKGCANCHIWGRDIGFKSPVR